MFNQAKLVFSSLKIDTSFFQYAFLLMAILVVESTILFFGYLNREEITAGFHAAMSNGLQFYGKEPSLSSVVDDIQSTVSILNLEIFTQITKEIMPRILLHTVSSSLS